MLRAANIINCLVLILHTTSDRPNSLGVRLNVRAINPFNFRRILRDSDILPV